MNQAFATSAPPAPTRTCRQVPATGDDRAGTHLHPVEPDSGNQPPSRQEQAAGQTVQ